MLAVEHWNDILPTFTVLKYYCVLNETKISLDPRTSEPEKTNPLAGPVLHKFLDCIFKCLDSLERSLDAELHADITHRLGRTGTINDSGGC